MRLYFEAVELDKVFGLYIAGEIVSNKQLFVARVVLTLSKFRTCTQSNGPLMLP
jgi:hypothetical protein